MIFTTWYHVTEKLPTSSDWYLAYKDVSLGDDYAELKYFYFDIRENHFYESPYNSIWVNVIYWVDIDFTNLLSVKTSPALEAAEMAVRKAIENFELIRDLTN